jgi:hypothetical protein
MIKLMVVIAALVSTASMAYAETVCKRDAYGNYVCYEVGGYGNRGK